MKRISIALPTVIIALVLTMIASLCLAEIVDNTTVIKLTGAGLEADTIIEVLRTSEHKFDTSASALIQLKKEGVSDQVLKYMIRPNGHGNATKAQSVETDHRLSSLPQKYGFFIDIEGKYSEIKEAQSAAVLGLSLSGNGQQGWGIDGVRDSSIATTVSPASDYSIIVYMQDFDSNIYKIAKMKYLDGLRTGQMNPGTDPQFFHSMYRVSPNKWVDINMYRPEQNIDYDIIPVRGVPNMYRLKPVVPLTSGSRYIIYRTRTIDQYKAITAIKNGYQGYKVHPYKVYGEDKDIVRSNRRGNSMGNKKNESKPTLGDFLRGSIKINR